MKKIEEEEHKLLAIWAADCAEHVLSFFEKEFPDDDRPRKAIEAARAWGCGEIKVTKAREFALAAHAAARSAISAKSINAARSAGHAAATAHVAGHAKYASSYAVKASVFPKMEIAWQLKKLPDHLKSILKSNNKKGSMRTFYKDIDEYINDFPKEIQKLLIKIRMTIKQAAPEAEESISYGMPGFKTHGKPLVYFAAFKNHIGLYATPSGHKKFTNELSKYKQGKGSVQFPVNKPIPFILIRKIVEFRVKENIAKYKK
jgi:uncharacterized protein YdhG (YjbR/CyaY superfamily)